MNEKKYNCLEKIGNIFHHRRFYRIFPPFLSDCRSSYVPAMNRFRFLNNLQTINRVRGYNEMNQTNQNNKQPKSILKKIWKIANISTWEKSNNLHWKSSTFKDIDNYNGDAAIVDQVTDCRVFHAFFAIFDVEFTAKLMRAAGDFSSGGLQY